MLDRAVAFAAAKHAGAKRKGTTIPYITHVVEAMEIVCHLTEDEEIRAAAVLHDTLEDTDTTREELAELFGDRIADLVAAESENKREGQPEEDTWTIRKQETIRHLSDASTDIRRIALGDKLANIRAMYRDYIVIGEKLWERFNQKDPVMQGMYYGLLANMFYEDEKLRNTPEYREYVVLCSKVFSGTYDGEGNPIEKEETEEEFYPGIPLEAFRQNLNEWLENPAWREYYETAPSIECQTLIALEFWYSETESEAAVEAMEGVETDLKLDDWKHLYKWCGNNPRKGLIARKIQEMEEKIDNAEY
ncbi:HD domain-containing protein [Aristaeella lactis]|nr:HD domain-containing protein [Aristaeella lactis]